ncbi:hypothetical protein LTR09_005875 [Extremus antarcticus]|uniref:Diphthine--ammonia ligase n=1 Tax=Extremus antarcticus TaxID=702011 RepID=A0AAJ0DFU3_9PEZI|nr:hypothetical protein LTR09_005875 [Extremus antarcticus]
MANLNVVCLISGGKDSLFSILHCLENGHNVVAIANLYPASSVGGGAVEDSDSYMYQTIGHTVIPLYERALGLPLYRQELKGGAINQDKCYGPTSDEDEAEALMPLLRNVKLHHPEVNAVSTGAILSDYQRTRVESVAVRLGLIPLSYLWQWPSLLPNTQDSLLQDMAEVGQDSRIIKVASGGLDESMLWQNVADTGTIGPLNRAVQRFGSADDGAVLGEGGEYETLALSGPGPLWKGRIRVDQGDRKVVPGEAGSASVHISKAEVELDTGVPNMTSLRQPALLEPRFQAILEGLRSGNYFQSTIDDPPPVKHDLSLLKGLNPASTSHGHILLSDLVADGNTAAEQMRGIMEQATNALQEAGHAFEDVAYSSIVLRDMADFASVNTVYGSFFVHPNPPARATIACANVLPDGKHVMVALTSAKAQEQSRKKGLHVQSRSYWAPANIGPYSQAISVPTDNEASLVYVAGQIPLIPASMELLTVADPVQGNPFVLQTTLALQHLDRVGRAVQVCGWATAIAFFTAPSPEVGITRSTFARQIWASYHQSPAPRPDDVESDAEDDSFDVWHAKFGAQRGLPCDGNAAARVDYPLSDNTAGPPPLHVVLVDALPRGSSVEWAAVGVTDHDRRNTVPHFQHLLQIFGKEMI